MAPRAPRARKLRQRTAAPLTPEVREAIRQLADGNAWEEQRLTRVAQNYTLLREELALVGACLVLLPRSFQHPDSLVLETLLQMEPANEELVLTVAGVLDVPEPETFRPSALGEELQDIHGEGGGFDSSELILLSLTYRRYLYLRTLCFGGGRKDAT